MDMYVEEGEATIKIVAKRSEFRELYDELRRWNTSSTSLDVARLLGIIREVGS